MDRRYPGVYNRAAFRTVSARACGVAEEDLGRRDRRVFGALAAAVLFQLFVYEITSWGNMLLLGGIAGVLGQLGDLAASRLKRLAGAKDSGSLLPGHGGVLDRFDAMLPVAAAMYLYLRLVAGVL